MKTCTRCGAEKALEAFVPDRRRRDGRGSWCRACYRDANQQRYRRDREASRERAMAWRRANPDRYREIVRRGMAAYAARRRATRQEGGQP